MTKKYEEKKSDLTDFLQCENQTRDEVIEVAWQGMPEFVQDDLSPFQTVYVHFDTKEDRDAFAMLVNQKINDETKYIYYPKKEKEYLLGKIYVDEE